MDEYDGRQFVGIDLHRRRSVIVRQSESGEQFSAVRIVNDPVALGLQLEQAGSDPEVVLEATYGWYWAVDVLQAGGARVHLAHPLGVKGFRYRRVKNDVRDAGDLADLLRMGRLPEAWIAPPETRELRELVRYRAKLVAIRSGLKAQIHAVLAKAGVLIAASDLFGVTGRQRLARVPLGSAYAERVRSPAGTHRHPRRPRSALRRDDRRTVADPSRLSSDPAGARHRAGAGGGVRRRDRRRAPFRRPRPAVLVGRFDPHPPRIGHRRSPRTHHQAGQQTRAVGGRGGHPASSRTPPRSPLIANGSRPAAAATSPRSPRPASCSRWSTTDCATDRSARSTGPGPREHLGRDTRAAAQLSDPRISALSEPWISAWSPL